MARNNKILVIRLSAMGDVAMISPVVSMFCSQNPDKQIYILTRPFFRPFFEQNKNVHFIDIDLNGRHKGLFGIVKLFFCIMIKYGRIGYVADLHYMIRSRLLSKLMKIFMFSKVVHLNKARERRKKLLADNTYTFVPRVYKQYIKVFEQLGFDIDFPKTFKFEKRAMPKLFCDDTQMKIAIAPFSQYLGKSYPIEKMKKVIDELALNKNLSFYIFGGGDKEQQEAEMLAQNHTNVHNAIGVISLDEELALISNMKCMVTMDSSSMHMASLFGVEAITIWGATTPACGFLGIGQSRENALQSNLACSPCSIYGNFECVYGDYRCFDAITPEMIVSKVLQIKE